MKLTKLALACALTGTLAACGGGGGNTAADNTGTATLFSGTVVDGYIEGATVCLDLKPSNQVCDAGEPSAVSKADGTYSLDITNLTAAQIKDAHLFTLVPVTAKDKDNGGKTLAEAGKAAFNLMAPASAFVSDDGKISSAVISPLTTLVSHDMISGNGKSLDDAQKAVRTRMNLPDNTDLKQDFVANKDKDSLHQLAQVVAAAIGEVKQAAKESGSTDDRNNLFAALSYLQQNVAALQIAVKEGITVKAALLRAELKPNATTLIDDARKVTASTATDMAKILAEGFYDNNGCFLPTTYCTPDYWKTSGTNGQWTGIGYALENGAWTKRNASTSVDNFRLTANGWALGSDVDSGTYTSDDQGGGTATQTGTDRKIRLSVRTVDLSGKTAIQVAGLEPRKELANKVFPDGSKLFWMQSAPLQDDYSLYTGNQLDVSNGSSRTLLTNLNDLISAYATANASSSNRYFNRNNLFYTFDAGGSSTGGTVSLWNNISNNCYSTSTPCTITGSAPYEIRTVYGQQVLIVKAKRQQDSGRYDMFASKDGKLHGGKFEPAGIFRDSHPEFNKVAINAIMIAAGLPEVVAD